MPEVSLSVVLAILCAIFSAGITWGVMASKQKDQAEKQHDTLSELKGVVQELKSLATEFQVIKAASTRSERDIEKHEARIAILEIALAKLQSKAE